jgi:phospholipid/cholesterol/gamma-HCH transport system substrate-binding protein
MRKIVLVLIIVFGMACIFLAVRGPAGHRLELTTYFADAQGLRRGAPVRLAGVDVGSISGIRVRPELRDDPAEVKLTLLTDYELKVPKDSTISLHRSGVLGETFAEIDIHGAVGAAVGNHGTLKSKPSYDGDSQVIERLTEALAKKNCDPKDVHPEQNRAASVGGRK